jgi:hypothetical protein
MSDFMTEKFLDKPASHAILPKQSAITPYKGVEESADGKEVQ